MVEDEELDALIRQREEQGAALVVTSSEEGREVAIADNLGIDELAAPKPSFQDCVEQASQTILAQQSVENPEFIKKAGEHLTGAFVENAKAEEEIAGLKKDKAIAERNRVGNEVIRDDNALQVDKWELRQRRREYHFNGVKPIMDFLHIKNPMCLFFLYFTLLFTVWFYIVRLIVGAVVQMFVDVFIAPFVRLKQDTTKSNKGDSKNG